MTDTVAADGELLINVMPGEIRAAAIQDGRPVELYVERRQRASLVGNVHLGRVQKIIPGMNAAFVELGLERAGFLSADAARHRWSDGYDETPRIGELLCEGEAVLVQVVKDAIGRKGVQLNRRIALPGRYLVYSPQQPRIAVSRMIGDEAEHDRLVALMQDIAEPDEGFIVRTNAAGASAEELAADAEYLRLAWQDVEAARDQNDAPALVHADLDPLLRLLRDTVHDGMERVRIDSDAGLAAARAFCARFMAPVAPRLELHRGPEPIFHLYDVEAEIARAMSAQVALPSGGTLVIEPTEALTAVDVNSASFTGGVNPGETARRTNLEAAAELARQIRLRNIAGLIVVDFIHMEDDEDWLPVRDALEAHVAGDRTATRVMGRTAAGLVEITRRRRRESLLQTMTEPCGECVGAGRVATIETVSQEALRALRREAALAPPGPLVLCAAAEVVDALEDGAAADLDALVASIGRGVSLRRESGYGREQFDVVVARG